jgi:hypothetical protein
MLDIKPMKAKAIAALFLAIFSIDAQAQLEFRKNSLQHLYGHAHGYYSYAPSVIDIGNMQYIWSCHNEVSFVVRDHIVMSRFMVNKFVDDSPVLAPSLDGWDSYHVCDPSVMHSDISYNHVDYHWVMFYLGNDVNRSARNQIGVAVSESITGPWEKLSSPIVHNDGGRGWGVGQPSAVPLNGTGKFLLIYSGNGLHAVIVDISNLNKVIVSNPIKVTTKGLRRLSDALCPVGNMDIALGSNKTTLYGVADINTPQRTFPKFITSQLVVASIDLDRLLTGAGEWKVEAVIGPDITGFPRNHNAGLVRNTNGQLADKRSLSVVFTKSCAAGTNMPCKDRPEWSYDLWEISAPLN